MLTIQPGEVPVPYLHQLMLGAIAPRPIAFASTISSEGIVNLAPFSFFNAFGANPPIVAFSPARSGRTGLQKDTLLNLKEVPEVVINTVSFNQVEQMNLASGEYSPEVNEFLKSGFTELPAVKIRPPRVKESHVQMECVVRQIIETGEKGGAGNLVIAEIVLMHINPAVLDQNQRINPHAIDLVSRMGGNYYCRASGNSVFEVAKPGSEPGIGFERLPESIRTSEVLTGNDLAKLAGVTEFPAITGPDEDSLEILSDLKTRLQPDPDMLRYQIHRHAQNLLKEGMVIQAWQVLLWNP